MWDARILAELVSVVGQFVKVDHASLEGTHCVFARACVQLDLSRPLKRCLELEWANESVTIYLNYESFFECCFYCGGIDHFFEDCPRKEPDQHFFLAERLRSEPRIIPETTHITPELQRSVSDDVIMVFPQC